MTPIQPGATSHNSGRTSPSASGSTVDSAEMAHSAASAGALALELLLVAAGSAAMAADIAVVGGSNDDAFWNIIKKGIDDATPAVQANGGSVNYDTHGDGGGRGEGVVLGHGVGDGLRD